MSKRKHLRSYLLTRLCLSFAFLVVTITSLILYHKNEFQTLDALTNYSHSFADVMLEQKFNINQLRLIKDDTDAMRNESLAHAKQALVVLSEANELFISYGKEEILKLKKKLVSEQDAIVEQIKSNVFDVDSLFDRSEELYFLSLELADLVGQEKLERRKREAILNILVFSFILIVVSVFVVKIVDGLALSFNDISLYVKNLKLKGNSVEFNGHESFVEFDLLKKDIIQMKDRVSVENKISESKAIAKTMGDISENVTHIINNPLAIIEASVRVIKKISKDEMIIEEADSIKDMVDRVSNTSIQMKKLINDEGKNQPTKFNSSNLKIAIDLYFLTKCLNNDIKISYHFNDTTIFASENEVNQCVIGLIENSLNYLVSLDTDNDKWIEISSYEQGSDTVIKIQDSGKVDRDKISSSLELKSKGNVGLFSIKQLINKNCGSIMHGEDEHTTFYLTLPSRSIFES